MGAKPIGGGASDDEDAEIVAEINVTPLTDIFLVLLIIFMVATTVRRSSSFLSFDLAAPRSRMRCS